MVFIFGAAPASDKREFEGNEELKTAIDDGFSEEGNMSIIPVVGCCSGDEERGLVTLMDTFHAGGSGTTTSLFLAEL